MKILLFLIASISCTTAFNLSDAFIDEINSKQNLWIAGRNFPEDTPLPYLRGLLGLKKLPKDEYDAIPIINHTIVGDIPQSFDARTRWPNCRSIRMIADQSSCGSCWAVSTASVISDRICIHSNGKQQPLISAKNLVACTCAGCGGGYPSEAFKYWIVNGLVTGGPYGSRIGCQPYPFPPHSSVKSSTPRCVKQCDRNDISFNRDLHYGKSVYHVIGERQIQQEIMTNGPVAAGFDVYSDFPMYKSGVYRRTSGILQGGHEVRIIGWGVQYGVKYWLVANSWNDGWGEQGLFKIIRGTNECKFEQDVYGGLPR